MIRRIVPDGKCRESLSYYIYGAGVPRLDPFCSFSSEQQTLFGRGYLLQTRTGPGEMFPLRILIFCTLPASGKHIVQGFLEGTTIHVNQALLFPGLGISDDRDQTEISNTASAMRTFDGDPGSALLIHFHEVKHRVVMQDNVAFSLLHLIPLGLSKWMIPRVQLGNVNDDINVI